MKRKSFLSILGIASIGTSVGAFASNKYSSIIFKNSPFFKLSLAQWSLHNAIGSGEMSPYDFGKFAKKHGFFTIINYFFQKIKIIYLWALFF